nr:MAG TPA_asm: minor tail protein [Caudoviricetes sp.]
MAERIRGLSIDLDLNDTGVNRSLASIRRSFRMFNQELRTNMNNFKVNEKSTESYKQAIKDLNGTLDSQKKNLNDLVKQYDKLQEEGKGNSRQAQNLATEISKQADNINYLEHQLGKVNKEFEEFQRQQRIAESGWGKLGQSFKDVGNQMSSVGQSFKDVGSQIQSVGSSLTNKITKPAVGATLAVGGIAAAFGWKRLSAMDTASAQLQGFTGDAKKSEEIMKDVKEASQTGMATLAENTAIATGALAAGVKQGDELQKYIKLVGDAATASGAPIEEMSQIFNRIQGTGKLMGTELEMIEHRLPGFTSQMAESMGMSMEEFKKTVSEGKVTAEDFQKAMTERVDGTADLMANTWSGMSQNLKAYIGILGEAALSETFDTMKQSLSDLIDVMKSDEAVALAEKIGQTLGNAVNRTINAIRSAIQWFTGLDTSTQKLIGKFSLAVVAAGPMILVFGKMVSAIGSILTVIGPVVGGLGGLFTGIAKVTKGGMAFATVFPKLSGALTFITGPIGIAIAAIIGIGTAFTVAYTKSETFRNIVHSIIGVIQKVIQWFVEFNKAILALFQGDEDNGTKMLEKLGLSESMIELISTQIEFVKQIFSTIFDTVSEVFTAVGNFIKETVNELVLFWEEHGQMIMESVSLVFKAIFEVISTTLNIIFQAIGAFIEMTRPIWETFLNTLKTLVTIAWNAIKLIIGTTLDVIKGVIAAVSALIQGDWRTFLNVLRSTAESIWTRIKDFITQSVNAIKNNINKYITLALNIMKNLLTQMWNSTKQRFTDMVNTARTKLGQFRDAVKNMMTQAKNRAIEQINKIVDGAKQMPGKMRDGIVAGKNKVVSGIKSLGNAMAGQLGKVVNGVIGGMNNVLGKIGVKASISKWNVPSFSRGTTGRGPGGHVRNDKIARDTLALVGDKGPGNGKSTRELVEYPNGKFGLYDNDQMIFAPKGTKIFNNKLTEEMLSYLPAFSRGTTGQGGLFGKAKNGVKKAGSFIGGGIKNIAEKAIDFLDAPKKVFDSIVNAVFGGFTGITKFMLQFAKGGWNKMKEALFDFLKRKFSEASVGKKQKWMNYPMTTPYAPKGGIKGYNFNGGRHYGIDYGTPVGVNITAPTAGRVTKQSDHGGGNVARLDTGKASQYFLHMNSVKTGKVGVGESVGKSGNTGAFTTGPHVHWQLEDPKTPFLQNRNYKNPLSILKGHQFGGLIESEGLFRLGEGNNPEVVVPLNEPSQAMKLIAYVAEKMKGKSKQTSQLPDYRNSQDDSLMTRLIETQQEQIELLKSLLMKDTDIYMDGEKLSKDVDRRNLQREKRYDRFKGGVYI